MSRAEVLSWDWRGQPNLDRLTAVITDLSGGTVHLAQVETGSDEYAIVLSDTPLSTVEAAEVYDKRWEDGQ
jgi:PIN domain nuclease of toxin-antitoxin system